MCLMNLLNNAPKMVLGPAGWGLALWGALQLANLPVPVAWEHAFCGPWGCGPKTMDLLAYHAFTLVLIAFPCLIAANVFTPPFKRMCGMVLLTLGGVALLGLLAQEVMTNWTLHKDHFPQRYLYRLAIEVDLPAMQAVLVGVLLLWRAGWKGGAERLAADDNHEVPMPSPSAH